MHQPLQQQPKYVPPISMTPFTFRIPGCEKSGDKRLRIDPTEASRLEEIRLKKKASLVKARQKKAEWREADRQAVAEGRTKPSVLAQASKKFPMMIKGDGTLDEYDIVKALREVTVPIPLHKLLFYAPGLHQTFLEAVGGKGTYAKKDDPSVSAMILEGANQEQSGLDANRVHFTLRTADQDPSYDFKTLDFNVNGAPLEAILDGGSTVSIMPFWISEYLGMDKTIKATTKGFSFGGMFTQKVHGILEDVPMHIHDDLMIQQHFLVAEGPETPFLLALDFIRASGAMMDPANDFMHFELPNGKSVSVTTGRSKSISKDAFLEGRDGVMNVPMLAMEEPEQALVTLTDSLTVDAYEISVIKINTQVGQDMITKNDMVSILEPVASAFRRGLIIIPTIVHHSLPQYTSVANLTSEQITVKEGDAVAICKNRMKNLQDLDAMDVPFVDLDEALEYLAHLVWYPDTAALPTCKSGPVFKPMAEMFETSELVMHTVGVGSAKSVPSEEPKNKGYDINPELTPKQTHQLLEVLSKHERIFVTSLEQVIKVRVEPYIIRLKEGAIPQSTAPYAIPHEANLWLKEYLQKLEQLGMIEPSESPWAAGTVLVPSDVDKRVKRKRRKAIAKDDFMVKTRNRDGYGRVFSIKQLDADDEDTEEARDDEHKTDLYATGHMYGGAPVKRAMLENGRHVEYTTEVKAPNSGKDPYRLCVDYRPLNARTVSDSYALPNINFLFTHFSNAQYFSIFDAMKGYWQLELHPDSRELTAFSTTHGLYQWTVLPMGAKNAPAAWQKAMDKAFKQVLYKYFVMYIDDGFIYAPIFEDHVQHLDPVLTLAEEFGLSISKKKCKFGYQRLKALGYIVGTDGFEMDDSKVERIKKWPTPINVSEVRTFFGLIQYNRRFVKDFAVETKPLCDLLGKNVKFFWGPSQEACFNGCKHLLSSKPILAHPGFSRTFILYTDASSIAISAVLTQPAIHDE
ncbi:hypothetical protein O0I10_013046 [Lichtheimia ornata]|uniref:Reverse transcriptase domain-containing protein n=1 Tax=Lichtheimia ornata TaxID=688661 RepID=A0AAD7UPY8_9FUNG|nr:uncharacterized protein O0I10_013046 [Lichtheimia ornata]KAJ8651414.1 hypothetical protein O0I10_013046 [Lichtheimia ornata]